MRRTCRRARPRGRQTGRTRRISRSTERLKAEYGEEAGRPRPLTAVKALQQLPDGTMISIGGQPEEAPHNRNLSMSSRKGLESWLRPAEQKRGAGTSSN
eukprot:4587342-Pleurochrysis_carterae.AAC.1